MSTTVDDECSDSVIDDNFDEETTAYFASSSYYSANYTQSNLAGTGRVLGNFYSYIGKRVERLTGIVVQKVGVRPKSDIIYEQIRELYQAEWLNNEKKSMSLIPPSQDKQ